LVVGGKIFCCQLRERNPVVLYKIVQLKGGMHPCRYATLSVSRQLNNFQILFETTEFLSLRIEMYIFREVIPGATTVLTNFVTLSSLETGIQTGMQLLPGNKQKYSGHVRRYIPTTHHHVTFNFLDVVLQTLEGPILKPELLAVDYAVLGHEVS
jgi:hypothetical protein